MIGIIGMLLLASHHHHHRQRGASVESNNMSQNRTYRCASPKLKKIACWVTVRQTSSLHVERGHQQNADKKLTGMVHGFVMLSWWSVLFHDPSGYDSGFGGHVSSGFLSYRLADVLGKSTSMFSVQELFGEPLADKRTSTQIYLATVIGLVFSDPTQTTARWTSFTD